MKSILFFIFPFTSAIILAQTDNVKNYAVLKNSVKDSLIKELFVIDETDQKYRNEMDGVQQQYGGDSKEMKKLLRSMRETDSLNLIKVSSIIDTYGWLGPDVIGSQGNTTLFMVIQHSDLKTQEKYFPLMKEAVKNGKAKAGSLALLEDRIALYKGKKQIYGSQLSWNMKTNTYYIVPIEDVDNVDKRRSEMGLGSLAEYIKACCDLIWDLAKYKKDLPALELEYFKNKK